MKFYHNHCSFAGLLGSDPKIHEFDGGNMATVSLAVSKSWKDANDEWKSSTTWIRLKCFGYTAEKLGKAGKGDNVFVTGTLEDSKYQKDGEEKISTELNVRTVNIIPLEDSHAAATVSEDTQDLPF